MERNFRTAYYGKMAVRGSEDKKTLEALLKEEPIDEEKLLQYCQMHPLPAMYRFLIWKIILHVMPVHTQSHVFVMKQRKEQYEDLQHALEVMQKIDSTTQPPKIFLRAYLLETGMLGFTIYNEPWHDIFISIATAICKMTDDNIDAYWLTVKLFKRIEEFTNSYSDYESTLKNTTANVLLRENCKLSEHLVEILGSINELPFQKWFINCFAGAIQADGGLERIWDIIIADSFGILPFIVVEILFVFERTLIKLNTNEDIIKLLTDFPYSENICEVITCKGIDLWKKYKKEKYI